MNESTEGLAHADPTDPAHIEAHIEVTREKIDRTLGELESRLSVRRRLDQTLDRLTPDITRMIRLDHAHVLAAFRRFRVSLPLGRKQSLVENACMAIAIHAQLEEEVFYPALSGLEGAEEVLGKSESEHGQMRALIEQLRAMSPLEAAYDATFKQLLRIVLHHVADEETVLLPLAEERIPQELGRLGREMTRRRVQLLRPHLRAAAMTTARTFPLGTAAAAAVAAGGAWLVLRGVFGPSRSVH